MGNINHVARPISTPLKRSALAYVRGDFGGLGDCGLWDGLEYLAEPGTNLDALFHESKKGNILTLKHSNSQYL